MKLDIDIDNITLDIISSRLKKTVSTLDILRWLGNFKKDEHPLAVNILLNMTVYTTNEIEEILNESFSEQFGDLKKNEQLVVHPVGSFGKSGSLVSYFFQKTTFYKKRSNGKKIHLIPTLENFKFEKKIKYHLVLLDDFIGSGKSVIDYCALAVAKRADYFDSACFIGVAGMKIGVRKIQPLFDKVRIPKANIFEKCFSPARSYFGYRKQIPVREMVFNYGKSLTKRVINGDKEERFPDALGFENSQALVSFSYGSPNNTLPIIWANKNNWLPLIPRFSDDKISVAREFRKSISHELSLLKEFGSENIMDTFFTFSVKKRNKTFSSVSKIDFSLYSIIKLSRSGFLPVNICHRLGILYKDYEHLLNKGKKRGLFNKEGGLTGWGLELYAEASKAIERAKKSLQFKPDDSYKIKTLQYLPKKFNGRS